MKVELTLKIEGKQEEIKEYFNLINRDSRLTIEARKYLNTETCLDLSVTKNKCEATQDDLIQLIEILNRI